jgi:hypothetical protein
MNHMIERVEIANDHLATFCEIQIQNKRCNGQPENDCREGLEQLFANGLPVWFDTGI